MNDHVSKPIDPAELYRTLRRWGAHGITAADAAGGVAPLPAQVTQVGQAQNTHDWALQLAQQVPGLDAAAALRRVLGNRMLYRSLLQRYHQEQSTAAQRLRQQLSAGDLQTACLLAHSVKGVSSNIGAPAVAQAAGSLEHTLYGKDPDRATWQAELEALEQALAALLPALGSWLQQPDGLSNPEPAGPAGETDLRSELEGLCTLLADMDPDALGLLESLSPRLAPLLNAQVLEQLLAQVRRFDCEDALQLLRGALDHEAPAQASPAEG